MENANKEYTEVECLVVWKTPLGEAEHLVGIMERSKGALDAVFKVKRQCITGDKTKFYRPESSKPERYFEKFKSEMVRGP